MQLPDLGLNRFLYKTNQSIATLDSSQISSDSGQSAVGGGSGSGSSSTTLITGTILQSSGSDNRIEINPDDTLNAYNNGNIVLTIDKNGLTTSTDINVNGKVYYNGIEQPVIYTGFVSAVGTMTFGPAGWASVLFIGPGIYQITHNLGLAAPYLRIFIQVEGLSVISAVATLPNTFDVSFRDDTGAQTTSDFIFTAMQYLP